MHVTGRVGRADVQDELLDSKGSGMSQTQMSHRSPAYDAPDRGVGDLVGYLRAFPRSAG